MLAIHGRNGAQRAWPRTVIDTHLIPECTCRSASCGAVGTDSGGSAAQPELMFRSLEERLAPGTLSATLPQAVPGGEA